MPFRIASTTSICRHSRERLTRGLYSSPGRSSPNRFRPAVAVGHASESNCTSGGLGTFARFGQRRGAHQPLGIGLPEGHALDQVVSTDRFPTDSAAASASGREDESVRTNRPHSRTPRLSNVESETRDRAGEGCEQDGFVARHHGQPVKPVHSSSSTATPVGGLSSNRRRWSHLLRRSCAR